MAWSSRLTTALNDRAALVPTSRGAVQLARDGMGPPVLVSHGGPGGFDLGLAWCRHLRDGGCELLAPSRPGYLRTPVSSGPTPADQADLYAAMLDELGIARVAIVGFSSGGPSAVQFAARHADRTNVLILEAAVLLPFSPPINTLQRAAIESGPAVWLTAQIVRWKPELLAKLSVDGMSAGLNTEQRRAAAQWIKSDPDRLGRLQEISGCTAPAKARATGWANDKDNEAELAPLPFAEVASPTLIAHGASEGIVPVAHATNAANLIAESELHLVEEGHHALPLSRRYAPVGQRQLELVHGH